MESIKCIVNNENDGLKMCIYEKFIEIDVMKYNGETESLYMHRKESNEKYRMIQKRYENIEEDIDFFNK